MSKGSMDKGRDARAVYADIIDLPHHRSSKHPHMSLYDRSAQFASYKALSGYEDMVAEEARRTDDRIRPEEYELSIMDRKLALIAESVARGERPVLTFTVFVPDARKAGGVYVEITDAVKRVDAAERAVILTGTTEFGGMNKTVGFDGITGIRGDLVDGLDD